MSWLDFGSDPEQIGIFYRICGRSGIDVQSESEVWKTSYGACWKCGNVAGWPQTWKNLEYSGNSLNLKNSWNCQGILRNRREKL